MLPIQWLMTDERLGDALWPAIAALPAGAGIVFRHYGLDAAERRRLFERVADATRYSQILLMLAGSPDLAASWGADGSHGLGERRPGLLLSAAVHDEAELAAALAAGADFVFISPVFPTSSHPGRPQLGTAGFARLAANCPVPAIALGGMNADRFRDLAPCGAHGWAAIDAWTAAAEAAAAGAGTGDEAAR